MIKWAIQTTFGLIAVFFIAYVFIWVLWEWLWLSIPLWIVAYLCYRKYGIMGKGRGLINLPKKNI